MAENVSKVDINGETILDLTNDTITADKMLSGTTAHDASGNVITGVIRDMDLSKFTEERNGPFKYYYITPTTKNITVTVGGKYLPDDVTSILVKGDRSLIPTNIIKGISIFGVEGTFTYNTFRTGTSEPNNSLGLDGDWYLVTEG